jgi:hypothetical protein
VVSYSLSQTYVPDSSTVSITKLAGRAAALEGCNRAWGARASLLATPKAFGVGEIPTSQLAATSPSRLRRADWEAGKSEVAAATAPRTELSHYELAGDSTSGRSTFRCK